MGRNAGQLRLLDRLRPNALRALVVAIPALGREDEIRAIGLVDALEQGELLTPAKELYRYFIGRKITLESLARAKAYWRVSMQSLLYQAKEVGVFGHYPADRLRHRISQLGWRTREPADTDFEPEQADLFAALLNLHTTDLECVPTMPWNECPSSLEYAHGRVSKAKAPGIRDPPLLSSVYFQQHWLG